MKNILAAFIFFTRLPLWKWFKLPSDCFKHVVEWWPLVGWLTGGVMAGVFYLTSQIFPVYVAIILALLSRVILTGGLHEDGLADFCDGFGAGGGRERILAIMKDSHIGTYGVIGLIFYYLLMVTLMMSISADRLPVVILAADTGSKFFASQTINFLPYARKLENAKNKTVYEKMSVTGFIMALVAGAVPAFLLPTHCLWAYIGSAMMATILIIFEKQKLGGYTGDCCGMTFLMSELMFYIVCVVL